MEELKKLILERLKGNIQSFEDGNFKYWVIDNLLPDDMAVKIARAFPEEEKLKQTFCKYSLFYTPRSNEIIWPAQAR